MYNYSGQDARTTTSSHIRIVQFSCVTTYHLKNGNYQRSIADFEQAQSYGHPDASRMLVEVRKQQDMAVLAKQQAEAERQRLDQEKREQEKKAAEQAKLQAQKSAVGMDYRKLQDLLAAGKWNEADEETKRVILAVTKRESAGFLEVEHVDNFPCEYLRTIDQFWVKYSDGHFGFSVQKRIYQSLGGTREYDYEIWNNFGEKLGWRKGGEWLCYKEITFHKTAPEGYLPWVNSGFWRGSVYTRFFSRVETCRL